MQIDRRVLASLVKRLDIYVLEEVNVLSLLRVVWKMSTGSSDLVPVVKLVFRLGCLKG